MGNRVSTKNAIAALKDKPSSVAYGNGSDSRAAANDLFGDMDESAPDVAALQNRVAELEAIVASQGGALILQENDELDMGMFRLTPTGMLFREGATEDHFKAMGKILFRVQNSIQWLIGDWLNAAQMYKFGDIDTLAAHYGRSAKTLQNWKSVAASVPYEIRQVGLEYNHHALVASMSSNEQSRWLQTAIEGDEAPKYPGKRVRWSVARLRAEIMGTPALPRRALAKQTRESSKAFRRLLASEKTDGVINSDDIRVVEKWLTELKKRPKS